MKKTLIASILLALPIVAFAQPAKVATCAACHGAGGAAPIAPNYPKLAGQNAAYIVAALQAYKNGGRTGGLAGVMSAQASGLSDAEMQELGEYYSQQ